MDHVDKVIEQWSNERSDLDVTSMAVIGRMSRLSLFFSQEMEKTFKRFGLSAASFDVLATLRRSGVPYGLSPGDLMASTMVTSGTMTNRIDQLQKATLVERKQSQEDKRSMLILLTSKGKALIDEVLVEHVKTQDQLLEHLPKKEQENLTLLLKNLLSKIESQ